MTTRYPIRTFCGPCIAISTILILFVTSSWAVQLQKQITPEKAVAVIHCNYSPVTFWDRNTDKPSGFAVDIIDSAATRAGLEVSYICKSEWPEMIRSIETGEAAISVLLKSEEREKTLLFSTPVDITYLSYFARSQSMVDPETVPLGDTVGVIRGSRSYEYLKNWKGVKLSIVGTYQEGIFSLLAGEVDIFAAEGSLVLKHAREAFLEDRIREIGDPFSEQQRCLVVRKDNVQLQERLNSALKGFVGSPDYQRIYLQWYGAPAPYWTVNRILIVSGSFLLIAVCGMAYWRYTSIFRLNRELLRTIDERKRIEETLRKSEEQYRAIVENQLEFVDRYLPGGVLTYVNDALARYLGMRPEELLGRSFYPFLHEDDLQELVRRLQSATREEPFFTTENRFIQRDGSVRWHQWTHTAFFDADGVVVEYQSVGRDITERKLMEEALRESERRYRQLFENMQEGFMIQDIVPDGDGRPVDVRYLEINPAIERFIGKSRAEIIGRTRNQVLGTPDPAVIEANSRVATTGQPFHMVRYSSGARRWYESFSYLFGPGQVATLVLDITERKSAEDQVLRSLREKEVLLKEIHHRVKNNMQVIYSLLNLQAKSIADPAIRTMFNEARNRVHSMALVHEKLYGSADLAHIDFREYLTSLVSRIAETYKRHDVTFSVEMEPLALDVNVGIPCGLMVNELVSNSLKHAFPEGRTGAIRVGINKNGEGSNVLVVADNGVSIPEHVDFRNTTSLGLQLVNVLAGQIKGTIKLSTTGGTEFRITFPGTTAP